MTRTRRKVAVVGGGWAGLAAAVEATRRGAAVTLFEMAPSLGGRAREVEVEGVTLDNGQHICIGAYSATLALMDAIGIAEAAAFLRMPLRIDHPHRPGLRLRAGHPVTAFVGAVLRHPSWRPASKAALLLAAAGWAAGGFRCDEGWTVARLLARLPRELHQDLFEPLCVAALNTPAEDASATVFLRVLRDALFAGHGSADLLLPRVSMSGLVPAPAQRWLEAAGAAVRVGVRVRALERAETGWRVDGEAYDQVVLAASALESARLAASIAPQWARRASALQYEPIATVYLESRDCVLPVPMLALRSGAQAPAQFVFDRGQLGGPRGLLALVVSGARAWVEAGMAATIEAARLQAERALGPWLRGELRTVQCVVEKRATFRCTPRLQRPGMLIAPGLHAAGDHVEGPYPASLEGAVRSGLAAAREGATETSEP